MRQGEVRRVLERQGAAGVVRFFGFGFGALGCGSAGMVRLGAALRGMVRYGLVRQAGLGQEC